MRRYLTVGILFGALVGVVLAVSWWVFPGWRSPTSGGFWTLLGLTLVGVLAAVKDLVSIWKDIRKEKMRPAAATTHESFHAVAMQQARTIVNAPGGVINLVHPLETSGGLASQPPESDAATNTPNAKPEVAADALASVDSPLWSAGHDPQLRSANTVIDGLNWAMASPSDIFYERLCDAFPGLRGVETFKAEQALDRLEVMLKEPLGITLPDGGGVDPFWWLRGGASLPIHSFRRLDRQHILMDVFEINVQEIVAVREFGSNERNFVYVHASLDKPTGLYSYAEGWIEGYLQDHLDKGWGYYYCEEYGLWEGKCVKRQEFDDGAALIDGKPTRIRGAELRVRYLTPYNFVICGKDHVLNDTPQVDAESERLLDDILRGRNAVDGLIEFVGSLHRSWLFRG